MIIKTKADSEASNLQEAMLNEPFSWTDLLNHTVINNHGRLNVCQETLESHSPEFLEKQIAIRYVKKEWPKNRLAFTDITYADLLSQTKKLAGLFLDIGLEKKDFIFSLSSRCPESYLIALASLRAGLVFSPLSAQLESRTMCERLAMGKAKVLFSLASLYHQKIEPIRSELTDLRHLIILDDDGSAKDIPDSYNFLELLSKNPVSTCDITTTAEDFAFFHFSSKASQKPKGIIHSHSCVLYHKLSGKWALDLKKDDVFWCTIDPASAAETFYGLISPLCNGVTLLIDEAEMSAQRWYEIIEGFGVTVLYNNPSDLKLLMQSGVELSHKYYLNSVRFAATEGEQLRDEAIWWAMKNLNIIYHDNWMQTETGGIMISNFSAMVIKIGSMGKPLPGIKVGLFKRGPHQKLIEIEDPDEVGEIAIKKGWPSIFRGYYYDNHLSEEKRFVENWYLSGDYAKKDSEGYYWFSENPLQQMNLKQHGFEKQNLSGREPTLEI